MKNIIFCREGKAVSDYEVINFVDKMFSGEMKSWGSYVENTFAINNALIIDEIRARVVEKKIELDTFSITVEPLVESDNRITFIVDTDGRSNNWDDSLELHSEITTRILKARYA